MRLGEHVEMRVWWGPMLCVPGMGDPTRKAENSEGRREVEGKWRWGSRGAVSPSRCQRGRSLPNI